MSRVVPIAERMDAALANGPLRYYDLAEHVFPQDQFPRAWRYRTSGGPPGLVMALSRAISRYGFRVEMNGRWQERIVHPRHAADAMMEARK